MALLTGEKRSASIIAVSYTRLYEITKHDIAPLIKEQSEVAKQLSEALCKRERSTEFAKDEYQASQKENSSESLSNFFLRKILKYFGNKV